MSSHFEPSLACMLRFSGSPSSTGSRAALALVAGACLLPALGGCGSEAASAGRPTPPAGDTASIDRSRCDDKGKQVVAADTNGDGKPDVLKLYATVQLNGQPTQVLVCRQVDMN